MWTVRDNVTGQTFREFDDEEKASWLCRGMNLEAGPGGRYSVLDLETGKSS